MTNLRTTILFLAALLAVGVSAAQDKDKDKDKDKSKPVRAGIEDWYVRNTAAFRAKDLQAVMALRTPDFHTLTPDGRTNDYAFMEERTRAFLDRIVSWISLEFEVGTIEVHGDLASATITQDTVRMQRLPDGTVHKVQAKAVQRETFRLTSEGWRLYKVDDIEDLGTWVDDARIGG